MSKQFTSKVALFLQVPVDVSNAKDVKAAKELLLQQLKDYAAAAEKDPNVIIMDMVFILSPDDYAKRSEDNVNVHLAELMAERQTPLAVPRKPKDTTEDVKPVPDKVLKPAKKEKKQEAEEVDPDEKPHVKAADWTKLKEQAEAQVATETSVSKVKVTKPVPVADDDVKFIIDKIFENLKRTEKSVTVLTAFAKAGGEVTLDDLARATKLEKGDICSWLNQTGKKVKAIESTGRGKYRLNPDKV